MIFPRRIPVANAFAAALLLVGLFHPIPAGAIEGPRPVTVTVEGEVRLPGSYTLPHGATLSTLVVAAGGYTDNADLAAATLTREYGETRGRPPFPPPAAEGKPRGPASCGRRHAPHPGADAGPGRVPAPPATSRSPARTTSA